MQNRRSIRGALLRGTTNELVVEDGFDRAIGARADLAGAFRRGIGPWDRENSARQAASSIRGPSARFTAGEKGANARKYKDFSGDCGNLKYSVISGRSVAGGPGFEQRLTESESAVPPLNYPHPMEGEVR